MAVVLVVEEDADGWLASMALWPLVVCVCVCVWTDRLPGQARPPLVSAPRGISQPGHRHIDGLTTLYGPPRTSLN